MQLKCTGQNILNEHELRFPLGKRNYDDLRLEDILVPRILIVVIVPDEIEEWIEQTEDQLVIRKCGYWVSLRGLPSTTNSTAVTVSLPRTNIFTPATLTDIMQKIHNEESL